MIIKPWSQISWSFCLKKIVSAFCIHFLPLCLSPYLFDNMCKYPIKRILLSISEPWLISDTTDVIQRMGKGGQKGKGWGRTLTRDRELDNRYHATPASTAVNATHFVFCLTLFLRKIMQPVKRWLHQVDCFMNFSKWPSWLLRHGTELLHETLSLTLHELLHFPTFNHHIQQCLSYIEGDSTHCFGKSYTHEVWEGCKKHKTTLEQMRFFVPFVSVVWCNSKGWLAFSTQNLNTVRQPLASEWLTTDMNVDNVLAHLQHNGSYRRTNIFFRCQSGHHC